MGNGCFCLVQNLYRCLCHIAKNSRNMFVTVFLVYLTIIHSFLYPLTYVAYSFVYNVQTFISDILSNLSMLLYDKSRDENIICTFFFFLSYHQDVPGVKFKPNSIPSGRLYCRKCVCVCLIIWYTHIEYTKKKFSCIHTFEFSDERLQFFNTKNYRTERNVFDLNQTKLLSVHQYTRMLFIDFDFLLLFASHQILALFLFS